MQKSGFDFSKIDCGVTPQAQKTGISSFFKFLGGLPYSGFFKSFIPISLGFPKCIGAPWTAGYLELISIDLIVSFETNTNTLTYHVQSETVLNFDPKFWF